jgi:hypothetical protein
VYYRVLTSGNFNIAIEKGAFKVDLPIQDGEFP